MNAAAILTLLTLLATFHCPSVQAQVVFSEEPAVARVMEKVNRMNADPERKVSGWRIQVLATSDRRKMESELDRFRTLFPGIKVTWVYHAPYYKIRAGAYQNKYEALREIGTLKGAYPTAYPTNDPQIPIRELLGP